MRVRYQPLTSLLLAEEYENHPTLELRIAEVDLSLLQRTCQPSQRRDILVYGPTGGPCHYSRRLLLWNATWRAFSGLGTLGTLDTQYLPRCNYVGWGAQRKAIVEFHLSFSAKRLCQGEADFHAILNPIE